MWFMQILIDESGDLGWIFDKPYRKGGSSRYLTLACLFLPKSLKNLPRNIIRAMYKKMGWQNEKKASTATIKQKTIFCQNVIMLLKSNPSIKIEAITVKKENVENHIREDGNKLYNYMISLIIPEYTNGHSEVDFIPDERSIKVKSGNSLVDYLQVKLWFDYKQQTKLINKPGRSHEQYNLQFIDWVTHCIWMNFEQGQNTMYDILVLHIKNRTLFF